MKIRVQQLNQAIGGIERNVDQIISALKDAEKSDIALLILPELCTCGYLPMDLLERPAFHEAIYEANDRIMKASGNTALIFGTITKNTENGRPCFNSALMVQHGKEIAEVRKALLPTYDVFDEDRYFERNRSFNCVKWNGKKLGITICEDIWANNSSVQYHTYTVEPVRKLAEQGADAIINLSASPFTVSKSEERLEMLQKNAEATGLPVFYANQVGGNTELVSDGESTILNKNAEVVARAPLFVEGFIEVEWTKSNQIEPVNSGSVREILPKTARMFEALKHGLVDYLEKTGVTRKVVLGLSGGIDSSLVACIATEALAAENVMSVAMPSQFSSEGSVPDAEALAKNLGIEFHQMPIKSLYDEYLSVLEPLFQDTEFGVAEENLQSRARGMLLMAIANKFNRFVLNTGNKSELATGYCTLYGDMNGALAVLSDVYKTEVYELARWLNESYYEKEVIPQAVIDKPPSAELRPEQKDSDTLPEYDKLDTILKLYIENQYHPKQITEQGYDKEVVKRVVKLVNQNEYKRWQAPPGLKIHNKAFGLGRRWPLVGKWLENI